MDEELQEIPHEGEHLPDRPLECSECRKDISVRYTEIASGNMSEVCMCNDCPQLQKRLQGVAKAPTIEENRAEVACGDCGTTMESLRVGHPLGCSHCYEIFDATIIHELLSMEKIPPKLEFCKKPESLHIGRSPGESIGVSSALKLIALNEALDETLKREDYEQAAKIRDKINELNEIKNQVNKGKESNDKK